MQIPLKLYSYWRSSTSHRVRIALNLKRLPYEIVPVHLLKDGGEHLKPGYSAVNPQQTVPTLVDGALTLSESLAIIEYLEERYPEPQLLPEDKTERARHREIAQAVACNVHPLNTLRVTRLLKQMGHSQQETDNWYRHWMSRGLATLEAMLTGKGPFAVGDRPGLADCCIVPLLHSARRNRFVLEDHPKLLRVEQTCAELEAFRKAAPEAQKDAEI